MKKVAFLVTTLVLTGLVSLPFIADAAQFRSEETFNVIDEFNEDLYIGAGQTAVEADINGDLFIGAGNADLQKEVNIDGDVFIGAGRVVINSNITGDLRMSSGQVTLKGDVGEDVIIGSGTAVLEGNIGGDVYVGGGDVTIKGEVQGSVKVAADSIKLQDLKINGDLTTYSENEILRTGTVEVLGMENLNITDMRKGVKGMIGMQAGIWNWILWTAALIVTMLVITALAPLKSRDVINFVRKKFWQSLGIGLLWLIVAPIVGFMLLFTFVGTPIGVILLAVYSISLYLGGGFLGVCIGSWLIRLMKKDMDIDKPSFIIWSIILGVIIVKLFALIPYIGGIAVFVGMVFMLGAMFVTFKVTSIKKRNYPSADSGSANG